MLYRCLPRTNLSQKNGRSLAGGKTLFNFRRNGNRQSVPIKLQVLVLFLLLEKMTNPLRYDAKNLHFFFYDHDATQSKGAHRAWLRARSHYWRNFEERKPKIFCLQNVSTSLSHVPGAIVERATKPNVVSEGNFCSLSDVLWGIWSHVKLYVDQRIKSSNELIHKGDLRSIEETAIVFMKLLTASHKWISLHM